MIQIPQFVWSLSWWHHRAYVRDNGLNTPHKGGWFGRERCIKLKNEFRWFHQQRKGCQVLTQGGIILFNENKRCKNIKNLKESVVNFKFLLHILDHKTCSFYCKDGFLRIMNQAITNNVIMATIDHPLSPLWRGRRNLVSIIWDKIIRIIRDILRYM